MKLDYQNLQEAGELLHKWGEKETPLVASNTLWWTHHHKAFDDNCKSSPKAFEMLGCRKFKAR